MKEHSEHTGKLPNSVIPLLLLTLAQDVYVTPSPGFYSNITAPVNGISGRVRSGYRQYQREIHRIFPQTHEMNVGDNAPFNCPRPSGGPETERSVRAAQHRLHGIRGGVRDSIPPKSMTLGPSCSPSPAPSNAAEDTWKIATPAATPLPPYTSGHQAVQRWLLFRHHVKARSRSITTMMAGKQSLLTLYAFASSLPRLMKARGSLFPVKLSAHLLTTSMTGLLSAAVGKTVSALPIGAARWIVSLVLLTSVEILG
uniref:Uncharacterized protein n=1 Tax=Glossina palpalis gambiensis TaxID=67801 RepID=A0A1B0BNR1_9MUSC